MITLKVRYKVGYKLYQKNLGFSEKRLDFQAFQKSGLEPVARATNYPQKPADFLMPPPLPPLKMTK